MRYIDVFNESHGLASYSDFVEEGLGFPKPVRQSILENEASPNTELTYSVEAKFANRSPNRSKSTIRINPGQHNGRNVVILEFHCDADSGFEKQSVLNVKSWFDEAHETLSKNFDQTVSAELKAKFGEKIEVAG